MHFALCSIALIAGTSMVVAFQGLAFAANRRKANIAAVLGAISVMVFSASVASLL